MESVDELRRALEAARAETAALRAAAEGADRAPGGNDTGDAGEADSAYRETYDDGYARTRTDGHAGPNARQGANTANVFWGGKNRPVPKFPKNEDEAAMWHLRFRAHLDGMGLGYTLDHAASPVPVKGDQRDLISRYGEQPVQQAQAAWACLLDATAGAAFEERVLSAVTVRDAWCQILSWTGPSSEAEKLFLERQLETVPNYGDEDPKLFFFRVDQLLTHLRSADIHKTERQIVNILVRNLSDHYEIEKRSRLDSPLLRRQDVEHIVRASWATRKTRQLEHRSTSGVTPNPHGLVARGGYGEPSRGGGRSRVTGRGIQQSWSRGGGNHHVNRQQQQQHPRSPSKPLTANFGLGGPFDGGTNAGGWPQEESPPSPDGSRPHCERCGRKGHVARICRVPSRFEGICDTCGQYGHRMRYCIQNQPAPHAHVVAAPVAPDGGYHRAMQQAGNGGDDVAFAAEDGGTRMKDISVVLFLPFSVARNRVMTPLLMSCSFQPAVAAVAPTVISRGPRRSTAVVTTATVPIGVRSSSTAAVVVVIVRNRSCDTTAVATVQHCGRSSSMAHAPSVALAGIREALAAMDRPMD